MRSAPVPYDPNTPEFDVLAKPSEPSVGFGRRVAASLLRELREMLPPTIFFFVGFNLIVLTTNLILADYLAAFGNFIVATAAALVVGKSVLVANAMTLLRRYDRAFLICASCVAQSERRLSRRSAGESLGCRGRVTRCGPRGPTAAAGHREAITVARERRGAQPPPVRRRVIAVRRLEVAAVAPRGLVERHAGCFSQKHRERRICFYDYRTSTFRVGSLIRGFRRTADKPDNIEAWCWKLETGQDGRPRGCDRSGSWNGGGKRGAAFAKARPRRRSCRPA